MSDKVGGATEGGYSGRFVGLPFGESVRAPKTYRWRVQARLSKEHFTVTPRYG
jgi:hypothetical protein